MVSDSLQPCGLQPTRLPCPHSLLEFAQTHVHWVGDAIQSFHYLPPSSLFAFNLPQHQSLSNKSALHIRWPKYWSFSFSTSPSNEYSGLILFRVDWFDLLAVQGTLKSLLWHHYSKASILQSSKIMLSQLMLIMAQCLPQFLCQSFFSLHGRGAHMEVGRGDVWCAEVWEHKVMCDLLVLGWRGEGSGLWPWCWKHSGLDFIFSESQTWDSNPGLLTFNATPGLRAQN